jgi:hypothetical protein
LCCEHAHFDRSCFSPGCLHTLLRLVQELFGLSPLGGGALQQLVVFALEFAAMVLE